MKNVASDKGDSRGIVYVLRRRELMLNLVKEVAKAIVIIIIFAWFGVLLMLVGEIINK